MRTPFREYAKNNIVLIDGAMGTELYNRGVFINRCFDELNLTDPKLIQTIHGEYADAGADVLETNTFGANRLKLQKFGLADQLVEINQKAVELARNAAGDTLYVAGAIGPLGCRLEPFGALSKEEAQNLFKEQAIALAGADIDLFILETFTEVEELEQAVLAVKQISTLPVIAMMAINRDGTAVSGTPPKLFAEKMNTWDVDAVGLNCAGPQLLLETLEYLVPKISHDMVVMPNAGTPRNVENRWLYMASPEYMAEYAKRFIGAGAKIIGGCCGTGPSYIHAMRNAIKATMPGQNMFHAPEHFTEEEITVEVIPQKEKSKFAHKLHQKEFVVSVELTPPKSPSLTKIIKAAQEMKEIGVDAINIPDGPRASSRVSPLAAAVIIEREAKIETVLHYCCRDRNLLGMQSDLLGAYSLGLQNVLIITGDPPKLGDYPDATAVFDVDAIGLTNMVYGLNHGRDIGGNKVDPPTGFLTGVGLNPGALDIEKEIKRFEWKVKAGAEFAITQPVFDPQQLKSFLDRISHVRIPIIAGIWPLVSLKNAEFMNNEVPGVHVPEEIMERMRQAPDRDSQRNVGVEVAIEILQAVRPMIEGVQISAPFGRVAVVKRVLSSLTRE
jgi:homocysteine S-methyltransferase